MQTKTVSLKFAVNFIRRLKTGLKILYIYTYIYIYIYQLQHCGLVNKNTLTITSIFCNLPLLLLSNPWPFLCNFISTVLVLIMHVTNG